MFTMKSKWKGFCVKCKHTIAPGDDITKDAATSKWVHAKCPSKSLNELLSTGTPVASNVVNEEAVLDHAVSAGQFSTDWIPSPYQEAIFEFIRNGKGNAVVEAVAGSGKTSTIVRALEIVPKDARVAFLAFNKHIAKELRDRCQQLRLDNVKVSTIHSLGFSIVRKHQEYKELDEDRLGNLMEDFWPITKENGKSQTERIYHRMLRSQMRKVVSLAKATLTDYKSPEDIVAMMERYGIEVDDNTMIVMEKLPLVMQRCLDNIVTIDYDDQIWLPLVHPQLRNHFEKFEYLFVDETQDLNNSQIAFIKKCVYAHGRIIVVGDRKQSLYGFRGADTEAIPRLIQELDATVLPLSISYRCAKKHVQLAKELVPQIEPSPTAAEGTIQTIEYDAFLKMVKPSDMVVCRTNAPLIKPAFECIKSGVKALIRGKDIGKELVNFVERFQMEMLSDLEVAMTEYELKEYQRLVDRGKELAAEMLKDKIETIRVVAKECFTVRELTGKLEMLFSDSNVGVVFSSVHRAKGLEAKRVFILKQELMPHPKAKQEWEKVQELNVKYVAYTRSKEDLFFVKGG